MDVAASAVSLIQSTITSLVIIRQTFTSIREGPEIVNYIANYAVRLLHILERLKSSPYVGGSQDATLSGLIQSCHADVTRTARELDKVKFTASDRTGSKLWKAIKSVLKEKEWKEFQARIHRYSSSLSAFINVEDRLLTLYINFQYQVTLLTPSLLQATNCLK